jgi:hypothetical protein
VLATVRPVISLLGSDIFAYVSNYSLCTLRKNKVCVRIFTGGAKMAIPLPPGSDNGMFTQLFSTLEDYESGDGSGSEDEGGGSVFEIPSMYPSTSQAPTFKLVDDEPLNTGATLPPSSPILIAAPPELPPPPRVPGESQEEYDMRVDLFKRILKTDYSDYAEPYSTALVNKIRKGLKYKPETEEAFEKIAAAINLKL